MGLRFTLSFYGGTQLDRELARIQKAPDNMWPVWNYLTDRFVKMEKRQFKTEGQYGVRWLGTALPPVRGVEGRRLPGQDDPAAQ